jgi:hypothetical protein
VLEFLLLPLLLLSCVLLLLLPGATSAGCMA